MKFWMHLKSINEMPSLIELAVTPVPAVFVRTSGPVVVVCPLDVDGGGDAPLLLLPHAVPTSASNITNTTEKRRPFM
jgi:hypothetical protein